MAAARRTQALRLYRALLRESQAFASYGYRTYAIRRIKDAFRENKNISDSTEIETLLNKAKTNLEIIRRQVTCSLPIEYLHRSCKSWNYTIWSNCLKVSLIPMGSVP
uniref:Complex 1 LYR protein domain-containing protein n=2 Tax=Anolis carolinensis TaxID=28377 RepID=H9GLP7_ANOCA